MKRLLVCLALSGCGHITGMTEPPSDWPELKIIDHGAEGMYSACAKYTNFFTWPPMGCAEVYFERRVCELWAISAYIRDEEIKHCVGRDHLGESTLADAWRAHKAKKRID